MAQTSSNTGNSTWKPLYQLGGIAALLAVFIFRRNLGAELMAIRGLGLFAVPAMPANVAEWFALLTSNPLAGLTLLEVFDLVEYALLGLLFLAVCVALWHADHSVMLVATVCGLVGVIVYFASNQAFAMLALSERYAAATTDAQRATCLAAGEALLAVNNPAALHQGAGIYLSLFFVLLAGLMMSVVMLRSQIFSKLTAVTGILANGFGLGYYIVLPLAPTIIALPFILSAPFRVTWYFLIARKLFQMGAAK